MSISAITSATSTPVADTSAQVQLARDEKKLVADVKAKAGPDQLAADQAAIASDEVALAQTATTSTSSINTYL